MKIVARRLFNNLLYFIVFPLHTRNNAMNYVSVRAREGGGGENDI